MWPCFRNCLWWLRSRACDEWAPYWSSSSQLWPFLSKTCAYFFSSQESDPDCFYSRATFFGSPPLFVTPQPILSQRGVFNEIGLLIPFQWSLELVRKPKSPLCPSFHPFLPLFREGQSGTASKVPCSHPSGFPWKQGACATLSWGRLHCCSRFGLARECTCARWSPCTDQLGPSYLPHLTAFCALLSSAGLFASYSCISLYALQAAIRRRLQTTSPASLPLKAWASWSLR